VSVLELPASAVRQHTSMARVAVWLGRDCRSPAPLRAYLTPIPVHGPTEHGEPWHEHDAQKTEPLCQSSPVVLGFAQRAARRGSAFLVSTTETAGPISLLTDSSELSCCAALAR
jgi:hypothetical protein